MTPVEDRAAVVSLINEAVDDGAGLIKACTEAGIDRRTYHRWLDRATGEIREDRRPEAERPRPPQALTLEEREAVLLTGWEVYDSETGELASELLSRAVLAEGCRDTDLVLHADNGGPQKSATLRATLDKLGVKRSFSRPRVSDDNAYSESLFRTTKYRPDFPVDGFESIDAARIWVLGFVRWYNEEHRHSAIKFVSPGQRHRGEDKDLLSKRDKVYQAARDANPLRWSGATRDWTPPAIVTLNPDRKPPELESEAA